MLSTTSVQMSNPGISIFTRPTLHRAAALILAAFPFAAWAQTSQSGIVFTADSVPESYRSEATHIAAGSKIAPSDPCVLYEIASVYARAGNKPAALRALRLMVATGAGLDPRAREFGSLADDPEFRDLVAHIRKSNAPVLRASHAFTINPRGGELLPEGIAYSTSTKRFYMGGAHEIFVVDTRGRAAVFADPSTGMAYLLGIRVDDHHRELWAVSNDLGRKLGGTINGLFRFRLTDGSLIRRYPLDSDGKHGLNDLVVAPDGNVYATATDSGTVVRLDPQTGVYEDLVPSGTVPDANGITISHDGRYLFVAGWYSITRIDLTTRKALALRKPDAIADGCNDGLYFYGTRSLIGIQNCVHATGRVMRYDLSPDFERIETARVLESYNPLFNGITTGAVVGNELFFVANTQLRKIGPDGRPLSQLDPLQVLRLPLNLDDGAASH